MTDQQHNVGVPEDPGGESPEESDAEGSPETAPSTDIGSSGAAHLFGHLLKSFLGHPVWIGIGAIAAVVGLVAVLLDSRDGSNRGAIATSAVSEIAKRPVWSSPPITYSEANKAVGSKESMPRGPEPVLPTDSETDSLTAPPRAILATQLAQEPEKYVRSGSYDFEAGRVVAVVGKVVSAEALKSEFLGERSEGTPLRPITQVKLEVIGGKSDVYVEFPEIEVSTGDVVVALGRVAAIGSTEHNRVKVAYLLAGRAESLGGSVDSKTLRHLCEDARRGKTEQQAEQERQEREASRGSG